MTTIINASPSNGLTQTADGSGQLKVQSNGVTTNALAWVKFNGVTTVSIAASYNVSSITRNATGDYSLAFATNTTDANYAILGSTQNASFTSGTNGGYSGGFTIKYASTISTSGFGFGTSNVTNSITASSVVTAADSPIICVAVFGN